MGLILTDQNVDERLSNALRRRLPGWSIVSIREYGYSTVDDDRVLALVAEHDAFLITHDARTVPPRAVARVARGDTLARTVVVPTGMDRAQATDEIDLIVGAHLPRDWHAGYIRLPI